MCCETTRLSSQHGASTTAIEGGVETATAVAVVARATPTAAAAAAEEKPTDRYWPVQRA